MTMIDQSIPSLLADAPGQFRVAPPAVPEGGRVAATLGALREQLTADRATNIGFPSTFDIDFTPLFPFFNNNLNNVGDPFAEAATPASTKHLEREVIGFFADLLRAPAEDRWGYVTTGGTEGTEYGLLLARTHYPDGIVYFSEAAHYSVPKLADKLRMPTITVRASEDGQLDQADLRAVLSLNRDKPAIVLATIGTTMTEAIDDVAAIRRTLSEMAIRKSYIHADAALSGLPLALLRPVTRAAFDLADGADSISVSGHKFLGSPFPCGVVLTRNSVRGRIGRSVDYISSLDSTLGGSRSGHAPLVLWYAINTYGVEGLRQSMQVAGYAVNRLQQIGWPVSRFEHAITVVLSAPPEPIRRKWRLATSKGLSHVVCVPGVTVEQIDGFVADLQGLDRPVSPAVGYGEPGSVHRE
jgi:histidine decarboxylase